MTTFTNDDLWSKLEAETGTNPTAIDFLPISDVEASARDDALAIRANPFLPPGFAVTAWIYDVGTSRLQQIAEG
jgi:carbonic anhydrase